MNHARARLVVVGSVNTDLVLRVARLPRAGETVPGSDFRSLPGGKGANQAVAAARQAARVAFVGCVGDDDFGHGARSLLEAEQISTAHVHTIAGASTGVAMILVESSGQNCIALDAGANAALSIAMVDAAAALIQDAAMLICQLESPLPAVQRAVALAHAAAVPVLLNPAPAQPLPGDLLAQVTWLVPNETEAAALAGMNLEGAFDPVEVATRLRSLGPAHVIVTLGAGGVLVASGDAPTHHPAPRVRAVDTTGAGDTFIGALAAELCAGSTLHDAVAHGQRAAAFSVTRKGAIDAMPTRHDLAGWP